MKVRLRNILVISKIVDSDVIKLTKELTEWLLLKSDAWGAYNV